VSKAKSTLRRLRDVIGLTQDEMAELLGYSGRMIQAVEYGRSPLTQPMTAIILSRTGINLRWLISRDPDSPMHDQWGNIYTRESFDRYTQFREHNDKTRATGRDCIEMYTDLIALTGRIILAGYKKGQYDAACHSVAFALKAVEKDYPELKDEEQHTSIITWGPNPDVYPHGVADWFIAKVTALSHERARAAEAREQKRNEVAATKEWAKSLATTVKPGKSAKKR
jgi:transcriptional regulator with XRE-family HTH domain